MNISLLYETGVRENLTLTEALIQLQLKGKDVEIDLNGRNSAFNEIFCIKTMLSCMLDLKVSFLELLSFSLPHDLKGISEHGSDWLDCYTVECDCTPKLTESCLDENRQHGRGGDGEASV